MKGYIVSNKLEDMYKDFKVIPNLKLFTQLLEDADSIDFQFLIYHDSEFSDFDNGVLLSKISKITEDKNFNLHFLYINAKPIGMIRMVMDGLEKDRTNVFEDDFYLDDEEELIALLDEFNETEITNTSLISVDIIRDFVQSFGRNDPKIQSKAYLSQVTNALEDLETTTQIQSTQITALSNNAIDIFQRAGSLMRKLTESKNAIEEKLKALELGRDNENKSSQGFSNGISIYPPYRYMKNGKVLVVKEYTPTRYLTSFMLGYANHLHLEMNRKVKIIFVVAKNNDVIKIYDDLKDQFDKFCVIDDMSANIQALYENDVIVINCPKKEYMDKLLSTYHDTFIVIDRINNNKPIVEGRVAQLNAIGGLSSLHKYGLNPNSCIITAQKILEEAFISLRSIKDYPKEIDARQAAYLQIYEQPYHNLDKYLRIVEDYE